MFLRRKPVPLSFLDLQDIYIDICVTSVKNSDLEAKGLLEDALQGCKALHTSIMYKLEIYQSQSNRPSNNEMELILQIKDIREENVKQIARIQVRLNEINGTHGGLAAPNRPTPVQNSSSSSNSHKFSIPSLRNGSSLDRTLTNNGQQRAMQRTLRSNVPAKPATSKPDMVQAAANISWGILKNAPAKVPAPAKEPEPTLFADFDQNEILTRNWERLSNGGSASSSTGSESNLIDLESNYFQDETATVSVSHAATSLENLKLHPYQAKAPPVPPKSRNLRSKRVDSNHAETKRIPERTYNEPIKPTHSTVLGMPDMAKLPAAHIPKSTPSTHDRHQKYSYTKPKPMNVQELMLKSKSNSESRINSVKATANRSSTTRSQPTTAKPSSVAKTASSFGKLLNISYNYKPLERPSGLAGQKPRVVKRQVVSGTGSLTLTSSSTKVKSQKTRSNAANEICDSLDGEVSLSKDDSTSTDDQTELIKSIKGIDETAATQILNDIVVRGDPVNWDDVVGLESAKNSLKEAVVYPFLRPDLFRGLREPTRGMLLFGPPGTGKTMLARAVATESKSTFFSISASSLTSKYLGESEKLVKALFLLARKLSPSIVFIDEIDSILGQRTEGEADSMRRIKNEFLVLWSELSSAAAGKESAEDLSRVLILGATNMPWAIDEAARRRFAKRVYIPLPERETRKKQITKLLELQNHTLLTLDFETLMNLTEGFSGSDITLLAKDSAMGPLRSLGDNLLSTPTEDIRPIQLGDFIESLKYVRPSVSQEGLKEYETWVTKFGSSGA